MNKKRKKRVFKEGAPKRTKKLISIEELKLNKIEEIK